MAVAAIGRSVFELRKAREITQETLAAAVGVSAQAVSKWESGGAPDADLLPVLADYFDVSIDRLFGRSAGGDGRLETEISCALAGMPESEVLPRAFELCWAIQKGVIGVADDDITPDGVVKHGCGTHSQLQSNYGLATMALSPSLRHFLVMPEPLEGWSQSIPYSDECADLFAFLGNKSSLRAMYFLYGRENKPFTPKLLEKALGVRDVEATQILEGLLAQGFLTLSTIDLDDEVKTVYTFIENPAFVAMMALCGEILRKPHNFYYFRGGRTKPYLWR